MSGALRRPRARLPVGAAEVGRLRPVRIVIAGGGTGGHTSAALAVADILRRGGHTDIRWIGSHDGLEATRAPEAGLIFPPTPPGKLPPHWGPPDNSDLLLNVP